MTDKDWGISTFMRFRAFLRMADKLNKFCRLFFTANFLFKCCKEVYGNLPCLCKNPGEKTFLKKKKFKLCCYFGESRGLSKSEESALKI